MIDFQPITPNDRSVYQRYFSDGKERGAEMSFVNLCLWGDQSYAIIEDQFVLLSRFYGKYVYTFPVGNGDKKAAIDRLIADSKERGIEFSLTGIYEEEKAVLETLYPDRFTFASPESFYDYVYSIEDLAFLAGKKYHRKRNHFRRFAAANEYTVKEITSADFSRLRKFVQEWYAARESEDGEYDMEIVAIERVLQNYDALGMYGVLIEVGGEVVAFTMANRFSRDTMDVNFEKATAIDGAYAAINCEFARYVHAKLPEIKFMNREEDMGIEGLRRAKENYFPHHRVIKYRAKERNHGN